MPLAVNTILLGMSGTWGGLIEALLIDLLGLAVVPTWVAVREHTPVESDKNYGFESNDEEQSVPGFLGEDEKNKITLVKSNVQV